MTNKKPAVVLRECATCHGPVPKRPHQKDDARACGPKCARDLAYKEHPDLGASSSNGLGGTHA